jgi:UDP-glucose 4-epimerase
MTTILVTGGAGFIGSHTCVVLLEAGFDVIVVDNFSNSSKESLNRIEVITGKPVTWYEVDICSSIDLRKVFEKHNIDAVIHFAGLKAVGESCQHPLNYYCTNLNSTLTLLQEMSRANVSRIIFSSSATVYASSNPIPYKESHPLGGNSPYAETKIMNEKILADVFQSQSSWNISILRYFNPGGAHPSSLLGENPTNTPNNLIPYVTQVAIGKRKQLQVFGNDYPTPDGTGVRDYVHVMDIAMGHLKALEEQLANNHGQLEIYNLGSGKGYSVLEIVRMLEQVSKHPIPYEIVARRAGDIAEFYADTSKIEKKLGWKASLGLETICADAWNWQMKNPNGF